MKISLLTDAPKHNLALMKISAWHIAQGDEVKLNMPLWKADKTYASILFEWNRSKYVADVYGGPAFYGDSVGYDFRHVPVPDYENIFPDYSLYPSNHFSLGYTFRPCFRFCDFCRVSRLPLLEINHHSIMEFYNPQFNKICLLNNNTFFDPQWRETFQEIWDANLRVVDENGFDLRLIDEEKANALKRTKWDNGHSPHFAWDRMQDEKEIVRGLEEINRAGLKLKSIYVLIGYDTTIEQDIYRCQRIHDLGHDPFPMIYKETDTLRKFRRMIYLRNYRRDGNIEKSWKEYR